MRQFVFQQKRTRNGKVLTSRVWSGEFMLDGDSRPTRIRLGTTDKRIAEKKLRDIVRQAELERANLIVPKQLVAAANRPVAEHIAEYLTDLEATGRVKEYVRQVRARLERLRSELGWQILKDMTPDSFIAWRDAQAMSPRTKNHFHDAVRGFANWLVDHRRIDTNLFENIKRAQIPKGSRGNHRSLSDDEARRLVATPAPRGLIYLVALRTGLRHIELGKLTWPDVWLDASPPCIHLPGEAAKNRRSATLPLTDEVADCLRALRPAGHPTGKVFPGGMPSHHTFDADLAAAGIPKHDHLGRAASFHTLRRTLVTNLHNAGINRRTAMAIIRHENSQLTDHIYADLEAMPQAEAMRRLPALMTDSEKRTEKRTEALDAPGRSAAGRVANHSAAETAQMAENTEHRRMKTGSDATCQNPYKNGASETPVELFVGAIRGWEPAIRRLVPEHP